MNKRIENRSEKRPARFLVPFFRESLAVCLVVCMMGCLAACGNMDAENKNTTENGDEKGKESIAENVLAVSDTDEIQQSETSGDSDKEIITLGTTGLTPEIENAVVKFNKENSEYEIQVVDYTDGIDFNVSHEALVDALEDARTRFQIDMTTGKGTDLIDLTFYGAKQYMRKGIVEDLYPYLENSAVVSAEDLNAEVLKRYEVGGKLPCIPTNFDIATLIARESDVGTKNAWTVDELITLAGSRPDAVLIDQADKMFVLNVIMTRDIDNYYDMSTGECHLDSEEFKRLLEFANHFPDEYIYVPPHKRQGPSESEMLATGRMLLTADTVDSFTDIQVHSALFQGDFTYIGYPTRDGSNGSMLSGSNMFGVYSKSEYKEGAWAFLESLQTAEFQSADSRGFPMLNSVYEGKLKEAMSPTLQYDEMGNLMADEDGKPFLDKFQYRDFDFEMDLYAVTQEDADKIAELTANAIRISGYYEGDAVNKIIAEEAGAYFDGQKSVDEVTEIIQNRVRIYIQENM